MIIHFLKKDPRYAVLFILLSYLILGFVFLGFNRTPLQAITTSCSAVLLDLLLSFILKKKKLFFPLSAFITSISLSILLNYSHNYYLLLVPVYFAIASKYFFTFNGKHIYNPAQVGVTFTLLFCGHLITSAPAYQWYGLESIGILIVVLGLFVVLPSVKRAPLVFSFLFFYTLQTLLRAYIMQHHLPFQTLFLGSITSPAFFLFAFFMISDPQTSPSDKKQQIVTGFLLAFLDLLFHIKQSYYTFFYAAFTLQSYRLIKNHIAAFRKSHQSAFQYVQERFIKSGHFKNILLVSMIFCLGVLTYKYIISPKLDIKNLNFRLEEISPKHSGINTELSNVLYRTDSRLHHIVKWILSVGDSVAVGDFNNDGLQDIFLTNVLKRDSDRCSLYQNLGDFKFEKVILPLEEKFKNVEKFGLCSNALFVDYDNDLDLDLFINFAFGTPLFLKNNLTETGKVNFQDISEQVKLTQYANSIATNFFDMNNDGRLDLLIGNVWPTFLPDYPVDQKKYLNVFNLPKPEYEGDIRMFNFMHESWHLADNGGVNDFYLQNDEGKFILQNPEEIGLPEHFWTLAIGTADFNHDNYVDLYIANDFGPDNFYINQNGKKFQKVEGKFFGDLGLDTYKGMNASVEDVNGDGFQDVYISNVHHELQAEGSLLWLFGLDHNKQLVFNEMATRLGVLNEDRFGWGAAIGDLNNDGLLDIIQANGMVDDLPDKKFDSCRDYWYTNEKIARSPPEIHRYIHFWGDIRGHCIYPNELNRLYLNTGRKDSQMWVDVAEKAGLNQKANSRGVSLVDLNNDGDLDVIVTNQFTNANILKNISLINQKNNEKNWLGLSLLSKNSSCNSMALGSKLKLTYFSHGKEKTLHKELKLANGFSAQNDMRVHFGMGVVDKNSTIHMEVMWCSKISRSYQFKEWNQYLKIEL